MKLTVKEQIENIVADNYYNGIGKYELLRILKQIVKDMERSLD